MKKWAILFLCMGFMAFSQKGARSELILPPKQIVQINYHLYKGFIVKIWNESKYMIGVSARDK
ncbi:MAG: hypothetical protein ACO2Y1_09245, partial [Flavobacteriaceae bacterium]